MAPESFKVSDQIKETVKTELAGPKYRGLIGTTRTIVAEEGARTLFSGLTAGLHR